MEFESILPNDWRETFFERADLGRSFELLAPINHFYAEAMRGRIRTLQLRFDDAWGHLDRAMGAADRARETIENLLRQFHLQVFRFDALLLESRIEADVDLPPLALPKVSSKIVREFPVIGKLVNLRRESEGKLLLHAGQCGEAAEVFDELIRDNPDAIPEALSVYYLCLAASQHGLGLLDAVERNLENAELATAAIEGALNAARSASDLHAFHRFLGNDGKAAAWKGFLESLRAPPETRRLYVERSRRLVTRCLDHARLVAFCV